MASLYAVYHGPVGLKRIANRIHRTSDWHLGQNFYSKSRAAEHQAFLDWLLETAQAHQVDAIIVAG
ncbi:hypothetical protein MJN51_38285, partial [Salmonella enterica subsp. enterica serovar Kentucky]|nr:hypothetical protein [Salmonella enterica subsp. enterica serovar Kentucky]